MEINIKKALESLESLRVEKEENEKRIKYLRQRKEKLEAAGGSEVADTVKGNDGVNVNIKMYKKWKIKMYIYPCYASAS